MTIPLIRPNPPRLSRLVAELEEIEASGIFSNNGPVLQRFERAITERLFGGRGASLGVSNATVGLSAALLHALAGRARAGALALMPAFTFAATAHAAIGAGLTPLLCDIDPDRWQPDPADEERLLKAHEGHVAAIVPYATFGGVLDLDRYAWLARRHGCAVVVDAAASLGTTGANGLNFGADCPFPLVYSMHATKAFATGEGGVIHCADERVIAGLRSVINFGFESGRAATLPGLNGKLCEVQALLALAKLDAFEGVIAHRTALTERYRAELPDFGTQAVTSPRQSMQFMSVLLPPTLGGARARIIAALAEEGIGAGTYFSPHLAEQPYFAAVCRFGDLPVSNDIGARIIALPVTDAMTLEEVGVVARAFRRIVHEAAGATNSPALAVRAA